MRNLPVLFVSIILALAALLLLSGCAVVLVGGGAAGAVYITGELKSAESAALPKLVKATDAAVKDLGFTVALRRADALTAHYELHSAANKKILLDLKSTGEQSAELRIRVGSFGDEVLSRTIHERIRKHL